MENKPNTNDRYLTYGVSFDLHISRFPVKNESLLAQEDIDALSTNSVIKLSSETREAVQDLIKAVLKLKNRPQPDEFQISNVDMMLKGLSEIMTDNDYLAKIVNNAQMLPGIDFLANLLGKDGEEVDSPDADFDYTADVIRGALVVASLQMIDELFSDLRLLERKYSDDVNEAILIEDTMVLCGLPRRYAHRYDILFTQRFLMAVADVSSSMTNGWIPLPTVAHQMAFNLLLNNAEAVVDALAASDDRIVPIWREIMDTALFRDRDFELLYDPRFDGVEDVHDSVKRYENLNFDDWFTPLFGPGSLPSPYPRNDT
ncbi:hypothetical protein N24_0970 [Corynebacterium suranareeae]|uniref:Uncharacterized protein n=1 Tax=Corynebacterium suranareeae TaxID=2506452 RepID=A0A169RSN8_9CORY|nr:hypothetical protein [Corynebacterium suranareeae]BAU95232.1 hypothetical protein N24_0970 [Corynebacterium suranareeae]